MRAYFGGILCVLLIVATVACAGGQLATTAIPTSVSKPMTHTNPSPSAPTSTPPPDTPPPEAGTMAVPVPTPTPYVRRFANVAPTDQYIVGAYWYPWYGSDGRHWNEGYIGTPVLGRYSSADPMIINQQIDWATGHGIDFWAVSWWGPGSFEDGVIRSSFLGAELAEEIQFAVFYESLGRLEIRDGVIDVDDVGNRQTLIADMRYLASTYFDAPNYLHIDGRPVVFLYLTRIFVGDVAQAMEDVREIVREVTGEEVFIVGDEVYWHPPASSRVALFDGVTAYNMHTSVPGIAQGFADKVISQYRVWAGASAEMGVTFVPDVMPGFDDTAVRPGAGHPVIPRSGTLFTELLEASLDLASGQARMVMITSWNEWHEGTSIEPAEEFGFEYLELLKSTLEGR